MKALPHGSLAGQFRMTEQGETIAQNYAYLSNAAFTMESLMASVSSVTGPSSENAGGPPPGRQTDGRGQRRQRRGLPGFVDLRRVHSVFPPGHAHRRFGKNAHGVTTIPPGGDRVPGRPAGHSLGVQLDPVAVLLPGWYGAGTALTKLKDENAAGYAALLGYMKTSPFVRYLFTNVETNLVSSSPELIEAYGGLMEDEKLRDHFLGRVFENRTRPRPGWASCSPSLLKKRRPRMAYTLAKREAPLQALHLYQVDLLRKWRADDNEDTFVAIYASINAIASGLRNTG